MKVIFLDFDGVLNSSRTAYAYRAYGRPGSDHEYFFDPVALKMLERLCSETGAKIVVSSSWRIGSDLEELREIFKIYNIDVDVIGMTPRIYEIGKVRGDEIHAWLSENEVESFVILDDDSDMLPDQFPSFVHVNHSSGLSFENIEECKHILNC